MRQKKSNFIYYVIAILILAATAFVVLHEVPMNAEKVEQEISTTIQPVGN